MLTAALGYGLIAMFAQGVANFLLKDATAKLGVLPTVIARAGTSAVTLIAIFLFLRPEVTLSLDMLGFAAAVSILGYFPFLFFVHALESGKVGVVTPVAAGWTVVAAVVSYFVFAEGFTAFKLFALGLIIVGILGSSAHPREWRSLSFLSPKTGIPFALLAALLWGIVFPLFKIPSQYFGALFFACLIESIVCISGMTHLMLKGGKFPHGEILKKNWLPVVLAGVLTAFFTLSISLGYLTGQVSIVSALGGSAIVVSVVLAGLFHKERLSGLQYAGIGLVLLGIIAAAMM